MNIISHRGFWLSPSEKNTDVAFERTLAEGFGTETDVRDAAGRLVVSHDPPKGSYIFWENLLTKFNATGLPLAVNIKSDGLGPLLKHAFSGHDIPWFAFDMSAPEMMSYSRLGLPFYTRQSDIETEPILYNDALGVWLDAFNSDWYDMSLIDVHLLNGKAVCVVSPELHGRDPNALWANLLRMPHRDGLTICSDLPTEARKFFSND